MRMSVDLTILPGSRKVLENSRTKSPAKPFRREFHNAPHLSFCLLADDIREVCNVIRAISYLLLALFIYLICTGRTRTWYTVVRLQWNLFAFSVFMCFALYRNMNPGRKQPKTLLFWAVTSDRVACLLCYNKIRSAPISWACKRRANKIRHKAVGCGIFGRFFRTSKNADRKQVATSYPVRL